MLGLSHAFNDRWKSLLDEVRGLSSSGSVAICNSKEVAVRRFVQVRLQHEAVLINLVRIVWYVADSSRKCILGDHISLDVERLSIVRRNVVHSGLLLSLLSWKLVSLACLRLIMAVV